MIFVNLGPGDNMRYGVTGIAEIINAGSGADVIITGGGAFKEVNSGNDHDEDKLYNESLPGFFDALGRPIHWVGGHTYRHGVAQEFHEYHLGAFDSARISIADWSYTARHPGEYRMRPEKVPGLFAIHGPGVEGHPTWLKAPDLRPGAQQVSMAGHDFSVEHVRGIVSRSGDHFDFDVQSFNLGGNTDDPASDNQDALFDFTFNHDAADVHLAIAHNTDAAKLAAVEAFVEHGQHGAHPWLLIDG